MLHSFCALVNHILHMCQMYVVSKILGTCAKCAQEVLQYVCSLCTVLKICATYVQYAHIKRKEKKVQRQLLVTRPSTGQAQCSITSAFNVVWSQTHTAIQEDLLYSAFNVVWSQIPTAIQEDLLYVQLHCLK